MNANNDQILTLYIMRGPAGSGKSTLAKQLVGPGIIFSTDEYFINKETNKYEFDPTKLGDAHNWNQERAFDAMCNRINPIVIDNTNLCAWEARPYVEFGINCGYNVEIKEPDTPWKKNVEELVKKNGHSVSVETIKIMLSKWENYTVDESLVAERPVRRKK